MYTELMSSNRPSTVSEKIEDMETHFFDANHIKMAVVAANQAASWHPLLQANGGAQNLRLHCLAQVLVEADLKWSDVVRINF